MCSFERNQFLHVSALLRGYRQVLSPTNSHCINEKKIVSAIVSWLHFFVSPQHLLHLLRVFVKKKQEAMCLSF